MVEGGNRGGKGEGRKAQKLLGNKEALIQHAATAENMFKLG